MKKATAFTASAAAAVVRNSFLNKIPSSSWLAGVKDRDTHTAPRRIHSPAYVLTRTHRLRRTTKHRKRHRNRHRLEVPPAFLPRSGRIDTETAKRILSIGGR